LPLTIGRERSFPSRRAFLGAALALAASRRLAAAAAAHDYFYPSFYVFVPSGTEPFVSVVNRATGEMIGRISLPFVAAQLAVSEGAHLLAAIDGSSKQLALVDLASGLSETIDLVLAPQRLVLSDSGLVLVAADLAAGAIAFVSLAEGAGRSNAQSTLSVAAPIRDVLFGPDDSPLYIAADGLHGVGVADVISGNMITTIPVAGWGETPITGLTRSADGLVLYAARAGDFPLRLAAPQAWPPGAIDGRSGDAVVEPASDQGLHATKLAVLTDTARIFPTGYGRFLVAVDNRQKTVSFVATDSWKTVATLAGLDAMSTVYSGWFDEVAIVASATEAKLLLVDLDTLTPAGTIALPGVPGPGGVAADGSKLYVPVASSGAIAVIDLQSRRLTATIPVDAAPSAAVLSRSFDVCH
jgi:YVTN family beta-propeller protein